MATPVNASYTEEYTLIADRKSASPTIFNVGVIDTLMRLHIDDEHTTLTRVKNGTKMTDRAIHHKYLELVRFGLRGWSNFKKVDGSDVKFETEIVNVPQVGDRIALTDATLSTLDAVDVVELGIKVADLNTLTREQRKN